jgi:hypothetical protein
VQIRVYEAPRDLDAVPVLHACPVSGVMPIDKEAVPAVLELLYADRREERIVVTAHRRRLRDQWPGIPPESAA